jgi:hypothetical protein
MSRALAIALTAISLVGLHSHAQGSGAAARPVVVDGPAMMIAVSASGKTLYGYSTNTGESESVAVTNPDAILLTPVVGGLVGCVAVGKTIHAFSAKTGHWATLELPEAAEFLMSSDRIRIDLRGKIYLFSAHAGKWATVDLSADKE